MKNIAYVILSMSAGLLTACSTIETQPRDVADSTSNAGWRVYRDPVTGQFGPPPAGTETRDTAPPRPVVTRSLQTAPFPGGGTIMFDPEGHFHHHHRAVKDESGKLTIRCEKRDADMGSSVGLSGGEK